ncbi:MAG: clan AA aspartic protease [Deltaproteobacteria bacterium]|nr:clan AA aspartic protease [Deltaproteobacteria bacterium]
METSEGVQTIVHFASRNGHILVPVILNGSTSARVLLDTGSQITVVSQQLARSLNLPSVRNRYVRLQTIAADVQAPLARLDSIEIAGLSRENFQVAVADLAIGGSQEFDGILGMDFLQAYAIQIDNSRNRIILSPLTQEVADLSHLFRRQTNC